MEGECSPRKKCDRRVEGEEEVDRISDLPNEIIVSILSSLPLKEAAATSVLSSRWFDLWKYVSNLNFDPKNLNRDCGFFCIHSSIHNRTQKELHDAEFCKYIEFVDSVLESHKSTSLNKLTISLHMHASHHNLVTKWLEYVVSRKVKSLEFDFVCGTSSNQVVLEKLLRQSRLFQPQTDVTLFKSLERLCLKNLKVSGAAVELLLSICPVLGELAIHHAQFTSDVEVCGTTDLMLKSLDVYCCRGGNLIKVSAPNLAWIRTTTSKDLLLDNVPKLVGANLTYSGRIPDDVQHFAYALGFSQLKFLKLTLNVPKLLLANGIPQMPNLKKLAITFSGLYTHSLLPLTAFLWASPRLREFRLKFMKVSPRDETESMQAMSIVGRPRHQHLKLFELRGFNFHVDAGAHIKLVKYIVDNCVGLEEIIIGGSSITKTSYVPDFEKQVAQSEYALARAKERLRLEGVVPQHIQLHICQCKVIEACQVE